MIQIAASDTSAPFDLLLRHDLASFAAQLDLASAPEPLSAATAVKLLNMAEELSRSSDEADKNRCLLICGLLWEHRVAEWAALPQFIMNLLSRIGLGPSMRMVDPAFQKDDGRLQPWGSIAVEAMIEARSFEHEVLVLGRVPLLLSTFQREVWRAMDTSARLGISAPTSAGKSFVLLHKALDILAQESGPVLYVVPTLSLIQQVTRDFRTAAARLGMRGIEVLQTYTREAFSRAKHVYVLTQERALSALGQANALKGASLVIIDEVQNVERAADEDEERAHTLFDVIQELVVTRNPRRAVISGPRVENIAQLTQEFFGPDARAVSQGLPPVVNVTYAFTETGKNVLLRQYAPGVEAPREIAVKYPPAVAKSLFGKKQYRPPLMDFLATLIAKAAPHEGTLVFSPTSGQATRTALALADRGRWANDERRTGELRDYVVDTVHKSYALATSLKAGVAYHHGKMPQHIRAAVEYAFGELDVHVLACTTTLMQGVNLPAKNLIARSPNLFVNKNPRAASLTAYEFANLRGRAGRLLKDFVGRAIILDETAFEQEELDFDFPEKRVAVGYAERFDRHREDIVRSLRLGEALGQDEPHSDLVVYVRQAVLRYGREALSRLARAGINITDEEYAITAASVGKLTVSPGLCARVPYWDPIVLDRLRDENVRGRIPKLPNSPFVPGFSETVLEILNAVQRVAPYYYDKYVGITSEGVLQSVVSAAQKWSSEVSLKNIISWEGSDADVPWEEIDRRITRVSQQVVYDVPKLLKPLAALQGKDNPIIGIIEMGAYRPEVRRLIELGVPRETAIRVRQRVRLTEGANLTDDQLLSAANVGVRTLNYWERVQIEMLSPEGVVA